MNITPSAIYLDRELSELDTFAITFSRVLERHTPYVLVSGYVSILLGRARASEDIDMLISLVSEREWTIIYDDLLHEGYYCLNARDAHESYNLLNDELAVRFAPTGRVIPNMELLFAAHVLQKLALATKISVHVGNNTLAISNLELQIAYKEQILQSPKDIEDARHLRLIAGAALNKQKLKEYERIIHDS